MPATGIRPQRCGPVAPMGRSYNSVCACARPLFPIGFRNRPVVLTHWFRAYWPCQRVVRNHTSKDDRSDTK